MTKTPPDKRPAKPTREQRLAAKLRENLRRRKVQSKARISGADDLSKTSVGPAENQSEDK